MNAFVYGTFIIGGSLAVALGGMYIVRKFISGELLLANHEVAGYMLSIVGTLYAILLGLIVVNVQTKFEHASEMAETEANCLSDLFHMSHVFSKEDQVDMQESIYRYSIAARDENWSAVSDGTLREQTIPHYRRLWKAINAIKLADSKQQNSYSNVLSKMGELSDARRYRMVATTGISPVLWAVLIVGELLIVWFTYFFFVERLGAQIVMTTFVVVFLSLNVFLVFLYNNPYRSELGARNAGIKFHPEWFHSDDIDDQEPASK